VHRPRPGFRRRHAVGDARAVRVAAYIARTGWRRCAWWAASVETLDGREKVYDGEQRRVVIVGGGFAAVHMCEELAKHPHNIKVTMICPNDHLDIAWASPRAIARPETANRNVIPLHKIFQRSKHAHDMVTHVHDTVAWVTETYVETAMSCERHEYDVLVIGTGATYAEGSEAKRPQVQPLLHRRRRSRERTSRTRGASQGLQRGHGRRRRADGHRARRRARRRVPPRPDQARD